MDESHAFTLAVTTEAEWEEMHAEGALALLDVGDISVSCCCCSCCCC